MGGAIANIQNVSQAELLARLSGTVKTSKANTLEYMSFDGRNGVYKVNNGTDEPDEYPKDSKVLLNLFESKQGYSCWKDGKPVDSVQVGLFDTLPDETELEDHGPYSTDPQKREGWKLTYALILKDVATGKQYQLQLSSASATRAFGALLQEILEQGASHDFRAETPIIRLGVTTFVSNGHKNKKPDLEITSWEKNPAPATKAAQVTDESEASEPEAAPKETISSSRKK
jgi:hypothetical protein